MKRALVLSFVALVLTSPTYAQNASASKQAKIEEMLKITKMDDVIQKSVDQAKQDVSDAVEEQREAISALPPAQAKIMNDFETSVKNLVVQALKVEDIHPLMAAMYDQTYTEDELEGIITFYNTPAGQALLTKTPGLMDKVMALVQQRITNLKPQIDQLSDKMQKDMAASQGASNGAARPSSSSGGSNESPDAPAKSAPSPHSSAPGPGK